MTATLCFIGTNGTFSLTALQTLLAHSCDVRHIILAGYAPAARDKNALFVNQSSTLTTQPTKVSIQSLAEQHHIAVYYAGDNIKNFATWEHFPHRSPPDFLFVACFPFRLPKELLKWPTQAAINLHPSLLPTYRGPDPLFWQLHHGETKTGISLHLLVEALDAGPILLQKSVSFPQGGSRGELDELLARHGAEAFCQVISTTSLNTTEQNTQLASYQPLPQHGNYVLDINWSAEHAFNFICGTQTPESGYSILINGDEYHIHNVMGFDEYQLLGQPISKHGDEIHIQFSPGVLRTKAV